MLGSDPCTILIRPGDHVMDDKDIAKMENRN